MSEEITALYEALELSPGAGPEEVRKAYFRLVRLHSPQKDPEGFQKIRKAYETLKDGPPQEQDKTKPPFPMPDHPFAQRFLMEGMRCLADEDPQEAVKFFEDAEEILPEDPLVLFQLSRAHLEAGNPGRAAKSAGRLYALCPDKKEAATLYSDALFRRGWHKKALPIYRKAYQLGERQNAFLINYANCARENGSYDEFARVIRIPLQNEKWMREHPEDAVDAFCTLADWGLFSEEDVLSFLAGYGDFLRKNHRRMESAYGALSPLGVLNEADLPKTVMTSRCCREAAAIAGEAYTYGENWRKICEMIRASCLCDALSREERAHCEEWDSLALQCVTPKKSDERVYRFVTLDTRLCILKNRNQILRELPWIQAEYPYVCEFHRDFLEELRTGDPDALFKKLKWQFDRISPDYSGSRYLERYPELPAEPERTVTLGGDGAAPFVRGAQKVSRNDPCPCGSGKKFKKCCMGKGIYD